MSPQRVPIGRVLALIAALAIALALIPAIAAPSASAAERDEDAIEDTTIRRVFGPGRIETAIEISKDTFADGSATRVVLARADVYADALSGAPLAAALGSPILLTPSNAVPEHVIAELQRLGATEVVILGGTAAVSDEARAQLTAAGFATRRVSGPNRFATAAAVADEVVGDDTGGTVFVVKGIDADPGRGWPDAVSVAPYAAFVGSPILLVDTDNATDDTLAAIAELAPGEIVIVGGTGAVNEATEAAVAGDQDADDAPAVRRLFGNTRYTTSAAVYDEAIIAGMDPAVRWVATGRNFPDTLAAGPAVAARGESLLLVDREALNNSPSTRDRLSLMPEVLSEVIVAGGTAAVNDSVVAEIADVVALDVVEAAFCLTVLHNNDGESALLGGDYGSIGRFGSVVARERALAESDLDDGCATRGSITVTSGDNFLAGPQFQASLDKGEPYYDSIALDHIGYDALAIGNHDFDFTPDVTAAFIRGFSEGTPFLSANLDWSAEPELQDLADEDPPRLAESTIVEAGGQQIGVIGAITPLLATISSPRGVVVDQDVVGAINEQVELLTADGAGIIVLISHLQGLAADLETIPELSGIDIVVAGGGDEVLGRPGELLVPGDQHIIHDTYPFYVDDADNRAVPVVTTAGHYEYVGRLVTRFDADGVLLPGADAVNDRLSRMVRVADISLPDGVEKDPYLVENVEAPVAEYVSDLAEEVVGEALVVLDGSRNTIRTEETNLGNLLADALRETVIDRATADPGLDIDLTNPVVGLQNSGGIRTSIDQGDISVLDTFAVAPFPNFVSAVEDVSPELLKLLLENSVSNVEGVDGRFAQLSNLRIEVDLSNAPQERTINDDGSVTITVPGSRIVNAELGDGTPIVVDGAVVGGAPDVTIATNDFTARGGDGYPFDDADFTTVGVTYQQSLRAKVEAETPVGAPGTPYAAGVNERIIFVE